MQTTVWKVTRKVAMFEDEQMVGYETTDVWYTTTKTPEMEDNLRISVIDQCDCEVAVLLEKLFEIDEEDIPQLVASLKAW
jgi:hypothetical protein